MSTRDTAVRSPRNGPPAHSNGIFGQLIDEWSRLCTAPAASAALHRWARTEPDLAAGHTLRDLLDRIDDAGPDEDDRILGALIRLHHAGQVMAGRTVLQAMLPKLVRLARTTRTLGGDTHHGEDRNHVTVATFWAVLTAYPIDRRASKVAAGLALDTLHQLTRDHRHDTHTVPVDPADAEAAARADTQYDPTATPGDLTADADLLDVIAWALDVDAITRQDAALLTRVYLPHPDGDDVAANLGLTPAALRKRCSRARNRLIAAVRHHTAQPTSGQRRPDTRPGTPRCPTPSTTVRGTRRLSTAPASA